jgi:hypothetical protein
LDGPGHTEPALRRRVADHAAALWSSGDPSPPIPDQLGPYLDKVALESYKVVDADVEGLRETAGLSEDEILELTLAAALGCGLAVLAAAARQPGSV